MRPNETFADRLVTSTDAIMGAEIMGADLNGLSCAITGAGMDMADLDLEWHLADR
jgi:hypothetical protein